MGLDVYVTLFGSRTDPVTGTTYGTCRASVGPSCLPDPAQASVHSLTGTTYGVRRTCVGPSSLPDPEHSRRSTH